MTTKEALEALEWAETLSGYCYDGDSTILEIRDWFARHEHIIMTALAELSGRR